MPFLRVAMVVPLVLMRFCGGGGGSTPMGDGGPGDGGQMVDAGNGHGGLTLPRCEDTEPAGTMSLAPVASTLEGTIAPVMTRVSAPDDTVDPSTEQGEDTYTMMGFGMWDRGPGLARVQRTDLGGDTTFGARLSLSWFVQLSDFQLVDDESPTRWCALDNTVHPGALRPQEAYLPRILSATNRTLERISDDAGRPFDFGIATGDCADSAQYNEERWVIDIMDGKPGINYDSGDDDDPVPGPDNDPKDPFDAVGFPGPWLYVPGNHDLEIVGVTTPSDVDKARAIGNRASLGTRDYRRWWAPVTTGNVPPDPDRRIISRADIVAELQNTAATPGPIGHGFPADADVSLGANYTYDAVPGLLRIVELDTIDTTGGSSGLVHRATVDGFLVPALEQAQSDGVLVMLASHQPTTSIDTQMGETGPDVPDAVPPDELEQIVASYPNVIAWLVGHEHNNRVRAIAGADGAHPGYWEIMTSAIADWPSQTRILELVDNGNGTLSIFGTLVDYDTESCMERRFRKLALIDYLSGWVQNYSKAPEDSNVELVIPIPPSAQAAVDAAAATAPTTIESETALAAR